jgi:hypothetical protein
MSESFSILFANTPNEASPLQGLRDHGEESVEIQGPRHKRKGASDESFRFSIQGGRGHQHDDGIRSQGKRLLEKGEPIHAGHDDIGDDEIVVIAGQQSQRPLGGGQRLDARMMKAETKDFRQRKQLTGSSSTS